MYLEIWLKTGFMVWFWVGGLFVCVWEAADIMSLIKLMSLSNFETSL